MSDEESNLLYKCSVRETLSHSILSQRVSYGGLHKWDSRVRWSTLSNHITSGDGRGWTGQSRNEKKKVVVYYESLKRELKLQDPITTTYSS